MITDIAQMNTAETRQDTFETTWYPEDFQPVQVPETNTPKDPWDL